MRGPRRLHTHRTRSPGRRRGARGAAPALRAAAWAVVVGGAAAPLLRHRVRLAPAAVIGAAAAAPVALCVARPRDRRRDVAVCALQMWAYLAAYEMPGDDPRALARRAHVDYPVRVDRLLGLGVIPTVRLQRLFARPGSLSRVEKVLVWSHWLWFAVPHSTVALVLLRAPRRFPRAAVLTYAVFDVGAVLYWLVPTAPPWYAAELGRLEDGRGPVLRRMMIEHGERFWGSRWSALFKLLGGNPLAAMPSLHFATSVNAARILSELGPAEAVAGWAYASTLGVALVYLGEHYVVDLLAGLALTEAVRRREAAATPVLRRFARAVGALESRARD